MSGAPCSEWEPAKSILDRISQFALLADVAATQKLSAVRARPSFWNIPSTLYASERDWNTVKIKMLLQRLKYSYLASKRPQMASKELLGR